MRNEFSHVRIQHKVPGNKLNKKLAIGVPIIVNNKPQTTNMWMHIVDYAVEEQFSDYKNNAMAWGRSNRNSNGEYKNVGKSGGVIRTGDGLYAQAEYGNIIHYNTFSLKVIDDALYNLVYGTDDQQQHVIVLRTGRKGAEQFNRAVKQDVSGWEGIQVDAASLGMIQKTSSPLHQNALSAGYMYTEYRSASGIVLKLEVDPFYDDEVMHKIIHPNGKWFAAIVVIKL